MHTSVGLCGETHTDRPFILTGYQRFKNATSGRTEQINLPCSSYAKFIAVKKVQYPA